MLTKDLILCNCRDGRLLPKFLDTEDASLLEPASEMLAVFRQGQDCTLAELEEMLEPLLLSFRDLKIAHGLRKVLEDRCQFTTPGELDCPSARAQLFQASAALLRQQEWETPEQLAAALKATIPDNSLLVAGGTLYPDLPDNDRLRKFDDLTPQQLLQRYNVSLVQGLLFQAEEMNLVVSSNDPAKLRRLFKYLHFFRLLADISTEGGNSQRLRLLVTGPASLVDKSRRYGLQLASFFPAVCTMDAWEMRAKIPWKGKVCYLKLTQETGLVCPYHVFSAILPVEIKMFHDAFKDASGDWQIVGETPFLHTGGSKVVFPDLSFRHVDGTVLHLELFHCWHNSQIKERLDWLARHPEQPLILGIDAALLKDQDIADRQATLEGRTFVFHNYPTVAKTVRCLNARHENCRQQSLFSGFPPADDTTRRPHKPRTGACAPDNNSDHAEADNDAH